MAEEFIAKSGNPTIHYSGQAVFGKNHYCRWYTTDGSTGICTIRNKSRKNTLSIVISGAPKTIYTTDGTPFNGLHKIPPNSPTSNITAIGDFKGKMVTIFNNSALAASCFVVCVAN